MDQQQPTSTSAGTSAIGARSETLRSGLYRRLRLIVAIPVVATVATTCLTFAMPQSYVATAVLQIDPRQKSASETAGNAPETPQRTIEDEIGTLQSDAVLADVVDRLSLSTDTELNGPGPHSLFDRLTWRQTEPRAGTIASLRARLSVARVRNTQLVAVHYRALTANKAAQVANAVTDAYLREQIDGRWRSAVADNASPGTMSDAAGSETAADRVFQSMVAQYGLSLQLPGGRVVAAAEPPAAPAGPKRTKAIAIAATTSLAVSVGVALLLTLAACPGKAERIRRALACSYLASLPTLATSGTSDQTACSARRVIADPDGIYTSEIRRACSELRAQWNNGLPSVVLVASAVAEEGTEGVASNIAHQLALEGDSVLLIDADLRPKTMTRQLAGHCTRGLLDQIACHAPLEGAILQDGVTGLCFLPASGPAPVPLAVADVLHSDAFAHGIAALKEQFSTIVIAAPAILENGASVRIAHIADQVVFVTAFDHTPSRRAANAAASLGANQEKITVAALTGADSGLARSIMSFRELADEVLYLTARAA